MALIKVISNTIELFMHTSCYCVLDLLCVTYPKIRTCAYPWQVIFEINNNPSFKFSEKMFYTWWCTSSSSTDLFFSHLLSSSPLLDVEDPSLEASPSSDTEDMEVVVSPSKWFNNNSLSAASKLLDNCCTLALDSKLFSTLVDGWFSSEDEVSLPSERVSENIGDLEYQKLWPRIDCLSWVYTDCFNMGTHYGVVEQHYLKGEIIWALSKCSTFQSFQLTYRAHTTFIEI